MDKPNRPDRSTADSAGAADELHAALALPVVVRDLELALEPAEVWALVSNAEGLATWLGEDVRFEPSEGASGAVLTGDGTRRALRVDRVEAGRSLAFRWWTDDAPAAATEVTFELTPTAEGTSLRVTERPVAGARACAVAGAGATRWDASLLVLEAGALLRSRAAAGAFAISAN
jgi:uncharacterized protein YndB with AHSA1/START domain